MMIGDAMLAVPLYGNDYDTAETYDVYLPSGQWMDFDTGRIYQGGQTLKSFASPSSKTLLFLGGSGVTLENLDGVMNVVVYPLATKATATLTLPDSEEPFTVNLKGLHAGIKWRAVTVKDRRGRNIPVRFRGLASVLCLSPATNIPFS